MTALSRDLAAALGSFCGNSQAQVLAAPSTATLKALRKHLSLFPSIKPEVRRQVLHLLGEFADAPSIGDIKHWIPQMDVEDRMAAVTTLGRIGTAEARTLVLEFKSDASSDVRRMVALALGRIGDDDALAVLRDIEATDEADYVRRQASTALGTWSKYS